MQAPVAVRCFTNCYTLPFYLYVLPVPMYSKTGSHFCQYAAKSVHHQFSKYRVHKSGNKRMNGQINNIMPPPASLTWWRHNHIELNGSQMLSGLNIQSVITSSRASKLSSVIILTISNTIISLRCILHTAHRMWQSCNFCHKANFTFCASTHHYHQC